MKKALCAGIFCAVFLLSGCMIDVPGSITSEYEYEYQKSTDVEEAVSGEDISDDVTVDGSTEEVASSQETSIQEGVTEELSSDEESTSEEPSVSENTSGDIDLNISMPEKNGTMQTDTSPDNKYIKIVRQQKGISSDLLVAVFSVPESGQNYVFEFYSRDSREVDNIRRVYLIDSNGKITGIAASNNSEKSGISAVENWFSMNVLIKEIIYPAIKDSIK